ncbi:MAG: iron ABC transporter permease [Pseudomonadota bacterium]
MSAETTTRTTIAPQSVGPRFNQRPPLLGLLVVVFVIAFGMAVCIGAIPLSLAGILGFADQPAMHDVVFAEIRLPRVVLAAVAGGALAISGAALQALFRNPLADPGLIGVSGGAAVGAIAMIVVGGAVFAEIWMPYLVPLAAVTGAAAVTGLLYAFARWFGNFEVSTMLLVGIALNSLSTVAIGAFEYLSDDTQLRTLVFWMMGSFGRATWLTVLPAATVMILAATTLSVFGRALDILQLGESEARHLSINVDQLKRIVIICAAAAVGAAVAVSGIIAFVGLIVPHIVRLMLGPSNRWVSPASVLLGAALCVIADLIARIVITPAELPVGLVTSALGGPFFLWLIASVRRPL